VILILMGESSIQGNNPYTVMPLETFKTA